MIKWLKKIFSICPHFWITKETTKLYVGEDYVRTIKQCQCKKCGAWKKFEV